MAKQDDTEKRFAAIRQAIKEAWGDLGAKEAVTARSRFSAFTKGPLGAHVRDVRNQTTIKGTIAALRTLESLVAEPSNEKKLRPDANETAFRVMREATGQAPKTSPPGERSDDQKDPEAVKRGEKGGEVRAQNLTAEEREAAAQIAALARWKKKTD